MNRWLPAALAGAAVAALMAMTAGCDRQSTAAPGHSDPSSGSAMEQVTVVRPVRKTLRRTTEQPGQIEAFEVTPMDAKIAGYVQTIHVDIGDRVKKGQVLAELWVPEMVEALKLKQAQVERAGAQREQARAAVATADEQVKAAAAALEQTRADLEKAQAQYDYEDQQYQRTARLVSGGTVTAQLLDEVRNRRQAALAARNAAQAGIKTAQAKLSVARAKQEAARADLAAAAAEVTVARAGVGQAEAMLQYARIRSPYRGIVTARNVNTGDLVQPPSGGKAMPLYTVMRDDPVRIFVNVPEADAGFVKPGALVAIQVPALPGEQVHGTVTRIAWALDPTARTLRTEIDLPNPAGTLRPGLYVYATIIEEEHRDVLTVPAKAVATGPDGQTYVVQVQDGHAVRAPVRIGLANPQAVEIRAGLRGTEAIVATNPAGLKPGQAVNVAATP